MSIQCPAGTIPYIIQPGDNLNTIAKLFNTTVKTLMEDVNLSIGNLGLQPGQIVCIPSGSLNSYTIQSGDDLCSLVKGYNTSIKTILALNSNLDICNLQTGQVIWLPSKPRCKWAGVRASNYGVVPFPTPQTWELAINHMASHWIGSIPTAIWLVGEVVSTTQTNLYFSSPGGSYDPRIHFITGVIDHHQYLNYFDSKGIKVFLQIEPGFASVPDQIDAVLKTFGNHSCVLGFAVDVEWSENVPNMHTYGYVSDALAQQWESQVKSYNKNYRLLLKHYEEKYLPPTYRGDLIFCCDDELNGTLNTFLHEHKKMADFCYPSPVIYQIGYPSDKIWWGNLTDPPKTLGDDLIAQTNIGQDCGVIWVDFSFNILMSP